MAEVTVGRDVGRAGRIGRIVAGALGIAWVAAHIPLWPEADLAQAGRISLYFLAASLAYTLLYHVIGAWRPAQQGWVAAVILLGPLYALFLLHIGPDALQQGLALYVSASLILNGIIGYGGCEVIALPTLLWRRRHVAYCPWNAVDAVERAPSASHDRWRPWAITSLWFAGLIIAYFVVWDLGGLALLVGVAFFLDDGVGLLLLLPAAVFAWQAASQRRHGTAWRRPEVRVPAIASLSLAAMAVAFAVGSTTWVWVVLMVLGVLVTTVRPAAVDRTQSEADA